MVGKRHSCRCVFGTGRVRKAIARALYERQIATSANCLLGFWLLQTLDVEKTLVAFEVGQVSV